MSVTGKCPTCEDNSAQFLTLDTNGNISFDCSKCDTIAAVSVTDALDLISDEAQPLQIK